MSKPISPLDWEACPKCKITWQGEEIPEKDRALFGQATHFGTNVTTIYDWERDITSEVMCTKCGTRFDRFTGKENNLT